MKINSLFFCYKNISLVNIINGDDDICKMIDRLDLHKIGINGDNDFVIS